MGREKAVTYLILLMIPLEAFFGIYCPNEKIVWVDESFPVRDSEFFHRLHILIFYESDSNLGHYMTRYLEQMLNQSLPIDLWDIKLNPFPSDPIVLRNFSLVILDGGIAPYHLDSDQKEAIWSAINEGVPFLFNYHNAKVYYDKFGISCTLNKTNYIWLDHNEAVLAPGFLHSAGKGWYSHEDLSSDGNSFYMNTSALPSDHKTLLYCNNSKDERPFPIVIYGKYGKGKFAVITGQMTEIVGFENYAMPWVVSRVVYWLLPDEQPLRRYWSYLSIAFRDDDLGGGWAGNVADQVGNMSMALSWGIPITWAFACEESSRQIWSDPSFVAKLKDLEHAGHEIFLHGSGWASDWRAYNYSEARERIEELMENYEEVLGHPSHGWVTPQHGYTDTLVHVLEDLGFEYDSEDRKEIGMNLLNGQLIDVSARGHPPLDLDAYKDYVDYAWLFGGRVLCFFTHFYAGDLEKMDQWINDFKEFISNYPARWITLDELAHIVHGQSNVSIAQIVLEGNEIAVKASSSVETTLFLELKGSTVSNAVVNGVSVHFRTRNAIMIRVNGETEVVLEIGTPKEDTRVVYGDYPPVKITFVDQEMSVSLMTSQGRNVTVQINIPHDDNWDVYCTEPSWGKEWDSTARILTVWATSDGLFTVSVSGIEDEFSPVANAGSNHTIDKGAIVILDGSGSYDNVGIVSYEWNFGDGSTGAGANTTHIYTESGTYVVTLTVKDGTGNSSTDSITVTVSGNKSVPGFPYESIVYGLAGLAGLMMAAFLLRRSRKASRIHATVFDL